MKELGPHGGPDDKAKVTFRTTLVAKLAAREVSQRGGGARRGSEAPELMSPVRAKSKRSGRSDV